MQFAADELAGNYGAVVDRVFTSALIGFSASMTEKAADLLSRDERVLYVEEDAYAFSSTTQINATWGLDRIDQRLYPLDTVYNYASTGLGVNAYIIDSGIRTTHQDFGGRAFNTVDFANDGQNGHDCFGHGTHVAGTVGSATYGVAKDVRLHSIRVISCDGSTSLSKILSAVDWVAANRVLPAVANISITLSGPSGVLDSAITTAIAGGVTFSIAAGNFGVDACNYSPGRTPNALTVGSAVTNAGQDVRMGYSNFGPCVDTFAPGNGIVSLSNGDDVSSRVMKGTSMAAPHVAGVAALYLQNNPAASPATVAQLIKDGATTGTVINFDGTPTSPNKMLYSWIGGAPYASVSGRVLRANGRGIARTYITATDENGSTVESLTNAFGYYSFAALPVGRSYVFAASHKMHSFEPRIIVLEDNLLGLDFTPL